MKSYAVSIIVPIYNVEKYIAKCATTLFEQDFDSIEYIFVNDCSPDNSMQVLQSVIEKYPNRKDDIKIINNTQNNGSSLTRKNGLDNASGEYILFIDSDDWVELDMVSSLYKKAKEDNADIVCCDNFENYHNKEIYAKNIKTKSLEKINDTKQYAKYILARYVAICIWNKIVKREIYENIEFPHFQHLEDMYLSFQLCLKSTKISHVNKALIHYRKTNVDSLSSNTNLSKLVKNLCELSAKIHTLIGKSNLDISYNEHFYVGLLFTIIPRTEKKFDNLIKNICPNANKVRYIIINQRLSISRKLYLLSIFYKLDFIAIFGKKLYRAIKNI